MVYEKTLCYGTLNPDLIYFIDDLPEAGGDIRSNNYNIRAGGTAINCAENIANWGMSVSVLGNSIGKDALGEYLLSELRDKNILHEEVILTDNPTPTCSIFVDRDGERTIVSSGYSNCTWNKLSEVKNFQSLLVDRYSIPNVKNSITEIKKSGVFVVQAGYEYPIDYEIDFLVVSKDEIDVIEAENLLNNELVSRILLTQSNLPARLISSEGAIEITPPDFKTVNATGAGDVTAAYIAANGVEDIISTIKNACAAGAILAGTGELPTLEKIAEISELVDVSPR
ncbi:carbohydrate kinase family protein [Acidimicrobiia bacterium]|nr:carbohydrate kinase family protein [Acidimicrobiia bacterium]